MRPSRIFVSLSLLPALLLVASLGFATDLKVKVTDPQQAVVAGARVALYLSSNSTPIAVQRTSTEGVATFANLVPEKSYTVEVAVPGFALASIKVAPNDESATNVELKIAGPSQTVVVSATRTPLTAEESATDITQINAEDLNAIQPVSPADVLRVVPGAIVSDSGRRGGLTSLFVRGGESRYNKVIVDGVPVNDPGGPFNFGTQSMVQADRMEFVRGAESTLYGSDAMTSVVQVWTRNGTTRVPELRFGADGGDFETAHGYGSLSGARGQFDYNLFADQFNTNGQGVNDAYSNSSQGANIGVRITPQSFFRLNARHSNSRSGVQSYWNYNGQEVIPPDTDQFTRENDFQASAELNFNTSPRLNHRITGFEYHRNRNNVDTFMDPGRVASFGGYEYSIDTPFFSGAKLNRAGLDYQGEYTLRSWATTNFGYHFEDENGVTGYSSQLPIPFEHGLRRNHAVFGQQIISWRRLSVIAGMRYEHNESFGDKEVPRVAASFLAFKGGHVLSGTRFRFAYGTGIVAPTFEESLGEGGFGIIPNPGLKPEENRSLETGIEQAFLGGKLAATATYFNNQFKNQIAYTTLTPTTYQYININKSMAHGAELGITSRPMPRLKIYSGYTYLSSQILEQPLCGAFCGVNAPGAPLTRRPKHSGIVSATWSGTRWGANASVAGVGRRTDVDLVGDPTYAAGYARVDFGIWREITSRMTAYVNVNNALNRHYEEVAGYPAMRANFRAGMRFRIGGE
jgi:vitamin B12 transporter